MQPGSRQDARGGAAAGAGAGAAATDTATGAAKRTPVGIAAIDQLLGGGIPAGIFIDIFGGHGTGKTQMLLQAAARFAGASKRVLYVDTAGTFRPERVLQMAPPGGAARVLEMISVARVRGVAEQLEVLERLSHGSSNGDSSRFDLVAIDSLTDLFSYEYSRYGDLRERNRSLFGYVRGLARLAVRNHITVMASNVVRVYGDSEVENMAAEVGLFAHARVYLSRDDAGRRLRGRAYCVMPSGSNPGSGPGSNPDSDCHDGVATNPGSLGYGRAGSPGPENIDSGSEDDYDVQFSYDIRQSGVTTCDYNAADADVVDLP